MEVPGWNKHPPMSWLERAKVPFGSGCNSCASAVQWVSALQKSCDVGSPNLAGGNAKNTHTIHVWYIYLHLVDCYGKCS